MNSSEPVIKIKPCSWSKMSALLGEWGRFLRGSKADMTAERAMTIAGYALAVSSAAAQGRRLPKDWARCHPSLPRQMEKHFEAIQAHPLVVGANWRPGFDIEFLS